MLKKLWRALLDKVWPPNIWRETEPVRLKPLSVPDITSFTGTSTLAIQIQVPSDSTSYISPLPVAPPKLPVVPQLQKAVELTSCANPVVLLTDTSPSPVEIVKTPRKRKKVVKKIKAKTLEKRPKSP